MDCLRKRYEIRKLAKVINEETFEIIQLMTCKLLF